MRLKHDIYGLLAEFHSPDELLAAAIKVRDAGYKKADGFAPFPIHGLSEALGLKRSMVPLIVLVGGICGGLAGFFMQYYANVFSYPYNIGGKPLNSWPAFIPITFEMTVLGAAFSGLFGMLGLNGLPEPYHPLFNVASFADHASTDKFFIVIESKDKNYDPEKTRAFLEELKPVAVYEVPA